MPCWAAKVARQNKILEQPKKQAKETGEEDKVFKQKQTGAEDTLAAKSQGRGGGQLRANKIGTH